MSATDTQFFSTIAERIADLAYARIAAKLSSSADEPLAYSIDQAATKLNLSRSTVKTMIRDREIAVVRRGTRVLITRRAIENWLERNET
jgi:excisionase family DNA binding protein